MLATDDDELAGDRCLRFRNSSANIVLKRNSLKREEKTIFKIEILVFFGPHFMSVHRMLQFGEEKRSLLIN